MIHIPAWFCMIFSQCFQCLSLEVPEILRWGQEESRHRRMWCAGPEPGRMPVVTHLAIRQYDPTALATENYKCERLIEVVDFVIQIQSLSIIILPAFKHLQALDVVIHSTNFSTTSRAWTCATLAVMLAMLCERTELTEWFLWYFPHLFPVSTSFATWLETSCNQIPIRNWTLNWNWNCCDVLGSSCEDAIEKKRQSFVNASQNGFKVTFVQICCKPDRTPSFFG